MDHKHKYERMGHPNINPALNHLGIMAGEVRQCTECGKVMPYIQTRDGWLPLFKDDDTSEKDILLA